MDTNGHANSVKAKQHLAKAGKHLATADGQFVCGVKSAIAAGHELLKAKEFVGHRNWLAWLAANSDLQERTAQKCMRLAKHAERIEVLIATGIGELTVEKILALIAKPAFSRDSSSVGDDIVDPETLDDSDASDIDDQESEDEGSGEDGTDDEGNENEIDDEEEENDEEDDVEDYEDEEDDEEAEGGDIGDENYGEGEDDEEAEEEDDEADTLHAILEYAPRTAKGRKVAASEQCLLQVATREAQRLFDACAAESEDVEIITTALLYRTITRHRSQLGANAQ